VTPALENVALWHERDISHSSVERFIGPDATITLDFALARLTSVVDKLVVYPERMQKNLDRMGGLVHSQRVLLALTQAGLERDASYRLVQRNAMKVWESDGQLAARTAEGRPRGCRPPDPGRAGRALQPRLPLQGGGHDLRSRLRQVSPSAGAARPTPPFPFRPIRPSIGQQTRRTSGKPAQRRISCSSSAPPSR
jgi:hypothetical protein